MKRWKRLIIAAATPALVFTTSCGPDDGTGGGAGDDAAGSSANEGKGDFADPLVCNVRNATKRQLDPSQLRDPVAANLLRGGECPTGHHEMVEKLQQDRGDCEPSLETYVVSETAQINDSASGSNYRAVVTQECGDETERHEFLWSLFGITGEGEDWRIPGDGIELMGYDESAGVYNYYLMERGEFQFFGSSKDILNGTAGRCGNCHTGGGIVMKELDTPWLHWEGHHTTPGAADMVDNNAELLGKRGSGQTFERITNAGNRRYNEDRAQWMLLESNARDILRPLFCSVQLNLDNATAFADTKVRSIPGDFFLDRRFKNFARKVSMDDETYMSTLDEVGSVVPRVNGSPKDTLFKFSFPERSEIDDDFVDTLVEGVEVGDGLRAKVLDEELVSDVLMVDFTRPILSDDRCGLLQFVPDVDFIGGLAERGGADQTDTGTTNGARDSEGGNRDAEVNFADEIRSGLIANLEAANPSEGSPEFELLTRLRDAEDDHDAELDAFMNACDSRDKADMMRDIVRMNSVYKSIIRDRGDPNHFSVFEFPQTMTVEQNLNEPRSLRFDPETCTAD